jgi:hypothetical protein
MLLTTLIYIISFHNNVSLHFGFCCPNSVICNYLLLFALLSFIFYLYSYNFSLFIHLKNSLRKFMFMAAENLWSIILSRVGGVRDLKRALDYMIGFIDTLFTQFYHWSTHFLVRSCAHTLGFSVFSSHILATDLSQSHCHFKSHANSSLYRRINFLPFLLSHLWTAIPRTRPNPRPRSTTDSAVLFLYSYNAQFENLRLP